MGAPLSLPVLMVSPGSLPPPAAGDHDVQQKGIHMVVAAVQTLKAQLTRAARDKL